MMLPRPPALRPRWTVTYALVSAVLVYSGYFVLAGMPLFSHPLPHYSGQYDVGTIDIESPVPRRNITNAVFKDTGRPAFQLETVLFSLYYPAVKRAVSRVPHHHWLPKPIGLQGEGYARLAKINNPVTNNIFTFALWMLAGSTTIPAQVDIPIHGTARTYHDYDAERPVDEYGLPKFPVLVFSHGTATSRTSYTHYCAELASRGYVVAAIEHRDGSGPGSIIMNEKQPPKFFFHVSADMIDPKPESADFKAMQLAMRQAEVEETVRVLRDVNNGSGRAVLRSNARLEGQDLAEWAGRLNMDRVIVGGHSFGATLALQTLKGAPSKQLPFVGAIVLDPGKHSGPLNDDISVPTLIVNSQSWSARHSLFQGRPHFTVVKDIVRKIVDEKKKYAWFMTAKGTTHPSVTDAPLIEPFLLSWATGATIDAREGVLQYVKVSEQFLQYLDSGHRRSILREETTHQEYDDAHPRASNPKVAPYWQIHMAPSTACPVPGYCGLDDD